MASLIDSPADWRGPDISRRKDWIHPLDAEEVREIEQAVASAHRRGLDIAQIDRENFPLPRFTRLAERALEELENGTGMFLIRGIPVERWSVEDARLAYWGMGRHLGTAVTQSRKGDVLGDVRDLDVNNDRLGRGYQSHQKLSFHTDSCDVVGLLVRRTAKSGGLSKIASSVAMHNQMLRERPDLVEVMYRPFTLFSPDWDEKPWTQPFFSVHQGKFCCKSGKLYIALAQRRFPDLPRLTREQEQALELFDEIPARPDFHFTMMFQPGDLQLLNNHMMLHARTDFEDYDEPDRKRHLFRLWLSVPNSRALSPLMEPFYRDVRPGAVRGGYPGRSGKIVFESLVE
jgi:hypothetical protein